MPRRAANTSARGAKRRQELIDAAFAAFVEQGYAATSVADITGRLGISHGAFYRYFDSKRAILDDVIDDALERFTAIVDLEGEPEDLTSADEFIDRVREIADRAFDLVLAEPGLARMVMLEATSVDDELSYRLMGLMDLFAALAAPYLQRAVDAGVLRPGLDTSVLADAVAGMLMPGLVLAFRGALDVEMRERQLAAMTGLLRGGIEK